MTFDSNDFSEITQPRGTSISNANGVTYPITKAGTVSLHPFSSFISHFVDSFSLLSVSQVTEELNCVVIFLSQLLSSLGYSH